MDDKTLLRPGDIATALALLSRLPLRARFERGADAAWAYPLAGPVLALIAALPTALLLSVGLPAPLAALVWLALHVVLTGAMHEDGLADSADGLWGGWEPARRLEIMKDSRIGSYGVIALCLSLAARWAALGLLLAEPGWLWGLVAVGALSRATMPALMAALPHARASGLSRAQGRPSRTTALVAAAIALALALLCSGAAAAALAAVAALVALACAGIARAKIGGQTGDILGATQQVAEIALLFTLTLWSAG
ncbi:adenosylcobinamide-GDP ribazoletransferase [Shimia sp.]|uniref:adenosylcobinamide-GDP ribazoletransferase n=1 Tax=Shimia sp. TaxID=1954381 RepID=UPI003569B666